MNRPIKFRGKRIDNGDWVYGTYHYSADGKYHYICAMEKFFGTTPYAMLHDKEVWQVDPETVGQLTELKDRNGKEIYFKDIVKAPSGNYFVVEWDDQEMRIVLKRKDTLYGFNVPLYEVVGNVFENPELL